MHYKHIDGVIVTAHFAEENGLRYRYRLEINLQEQFVGGKAACVVMQNPSYAGKEIADKSVQFMEKVVFQNGLLEFQSVHRLIIVNQFAHVQTNHFQGQPHEIGANNNIAIETALRESEIIIIGWGSGNPFEERKAFVLGLLKEMNGKQLFKTKMHPSRGRYDGFIQPLSI